MDPFSQSRFADIDRRHLVRPSTLCPTGNKGNPAESRHSPREQVPNTQTRCMLRARDRTWWRPPFLRVRCPRLEAAVRVRAGLTAAVPRVARFPIAHSFPGLWWRRQGADGGGRGGLRVCVRGAGRRDARAKSEAWFAPQDTASRVLYADAPSRAQDSDAGSCSASRKDNGDPTCPPTPPVPQSQPASPPYQIAHCGLLSLCHAGPCGGERKPGCLSTQTGGGSSRSCGLCGVDLDVLPVRRENDGRAGPSTVRLSEPDRGLMGLPLVERHFEVFAAGRGG